MVKSKDYYKEKAQRVLGYAGILSRVFKPGGKTEEEKVLENLKEARDEWKSKEIYFETVTDPDLVDHAIYELKASKIKYAYLLKKVKENNIR